jgi:ABC-type cobalamin/Fe3+-siderophores transport system ATPase subunit
VPETVLVLLEKNGAGKSTMLKMLLGIFYSTGVILKKREVRMGFYVRILILSKAVTVLEEAYEALSI